MKKSPAKATNYAVRVILDDGTVVPAQPEELEWVSHSVAHKIAEKIWNARQSVVNSPVTAIEIINADYKTVKIVRF